MKPVLQARGLTKRYGKITTVHDVDVEVYPGEIVGLLGANGAGKTTSFHMICGLTKPSEGQILLDGQDVTRWSMSRRCKAGLGYLPQEHSLFGALTVEQNLIGALEYYGVPRRERRSKCEEILKRYDLWEDPVKGPIYKRVVGYGGAGGLSGGERRRLEFARAVAGNPKILMLDEPFAACDPETISKIQRAVFELADSGIAVLINDHAIANTLKITERAYVIDRGCVLCSGSAMETLSNPEAIHYYFTHEAKDNAETIGRAHGYSPEEAREMVARAYEEVERRWPEDVEFLNGRSSRPAPTDDDYGLSSSSTRRGGFASRFRATRRFPTNAPRREDDVSQRDVSSFRDSSLRRRRPPEYGAPNSSRVHDDAEERFDDNRLKRRSDSSRVHDDVETQDFFRGSTNRKSLALRRNNDGQTRQTPSPRDMEPKENRYSDKTDKLLRRRRNQ